MITLPNTAIVRDMQHIAGEVGIISDLKSALVANSNGDTQRVSVDLTRALHMLGVSDTEIRAMLRQKVRL